MSLTISRAALKKHVDIAMRDLEYAATISRYLKGLAEDRYDSLLVDSVFQKDWRQGEIDIYDAHVFSIIHTETLTGKILSCSIPTGDVPLADSDVVGNNEILSRLQDFRAVFEPERGRSATCDGTVSWDFDLGLYTSILQEDGSHETWKYWIAPGAAPLEVGTTDASRTFQHLSEEQCVCRWPYDASRMLLLVRAADVKTLDKELISCGPCDCTMRKTASSSVIPAPTRAGAGRLDDKCQTCQRALTDIERASLKRSQERWKHEDCE